MLDFLVCDLPEVCPLQEELADEAVSVLNRRFLSGVVQLAEVELHASKSFVTFTIPCELLAPLGGDCLKGTVQQKFDLGLGDVPAVVVASSRDKEPGRSVSKRKQAYRPYCHERVVYPVTEVRAYSCLLGPIL